MDGSVSKADFARIYGCHPAYVTRLVQRGKLVTTPDGRRVVVESSLRLLEANRDLSKQGVRERWDAYRSGARLPAAAPTGQAPDAPAVSDVASPTFAAASGAAPLSNGSRPLSLAGAAPVADGSGSNGQKAGPDSAPRGSAYHQAQTDLTRAQAALKQLELRKFAGELAEVEPMRKAVLDVVVAARSAILALPDRVAAQLAAESDAAKVHLLLTAECERVCAAAQRNVDLLLRQVTAATT